MTTSLVRKASADGIGRSIEFTVRVHHLVRQMKVTIGRELGIEGLAPGGLLHDRV